MTIISSHAHTSGFKGNIYWQRLKSRKMLIFVFGLLLISLLFYLKQINSITTSGYKLRELESKASELKDKNKKLELQITELRSSQRVAKEVEVLKMEEVVRMEYLNPDGTSVAWNR